MYDSERDFWIALYYYGEETHLQMLLSEFKKALADTSLEAMRLPEWIGNNFLIEYVWTVIIIKYGNYKQGNYETSPRFGWVGKDKLESCVEHLEKICDQISGYKILMDA